MLVASGKRNRLKRDKRNLFRIVQRETNNRSDLVVVHAVDQRGHENNIDAGFVQIVDGAKLDVKQVADLTVRVRVVADSVKLQVDETKSGFGSLTAKFFRFGKFDAVGRGLHR